MQSPKKAFAVLCMHQGRARVRSASHIGRILNKSASWAGIPGFSLSSPCSLVKCLIALDMLSLKACWKLQTGCTRSEVQATCSLCSYQIKFKIIKFGTVPPPHSIHMCNLLVAWGTRSSILCLTLATNHQWYSDKFRNNKNSVAEL